MKVEISEGLTCSESECKNVYYLVVQSENVTLLLQLKRLILQRLRYRVGIKMSRRETTVSIWHNTVYIRVPSDIVVKYRRFFPDGTETRRNLAYITDIREEPDRLILVIEIPKLLDASR